MKLESYHAMRMNKVLRRARGIGQLAGVIHCASDGGANYMTHVHRLLPRPSTLSGRSPHTSFGRG